MGEDTIKEKSAKRIIYIMKNGKEKDVERRYQGEISIIQAKEYATRKLEYGERDTMLIRYLIDKDVRHILKLCIVF